MNFGAHELLETQEALRTQMAHIELYGVLGDMVQDPQLRNTLENQQRRMVQRYYQGVGMLQGRGVQAPQNPQFQLTQEPRMGMQNQTMPNPNPNTRRLSDMAISTVALNLHKTGSMVSMLWASECVDPQVRAWHASSANQCQEMAYEIWQYMNNKGWYQVPHFPSQMANTMVQSFQSGSIPTM